VNLEERTPPVGAPSTGMRLDVLSTPRPRFIQSVTAQLERAVVSPSAFGRRVGYFKPCAPTSPLGGVGCGITWALPNNVTRTYETPNPAAVAAADRWTRTRLVGTALPAEPAGVFSQSAPQVSRDRGFLFDCTWARRTSPNGSRGGIGVLSAIGPNANPSEAADSVMVGYDPTDTDGLYYLHHHQGAGIGVNLTRIPIAGALRTPDRVYRLILSCEAGATSMFAALIDVSNPTAWSVLLDAEITTNLPGAGVMLGFELNASGGPNGGGVGQTPQTLDLMNMEVWTR
jgi:hypothetical protein